MVTVADLEATPDDGNRYEVIEGELYVSSPCYLTHQFALGRLYFALENYLQDHRIGKSIIGPGIVFDQFNGVIPDLVYVSNERLSRIVERDHHFNAAPEIVIEILSPGSANEHRDRVIKRWLFSTVGVSEYWILNPIAREISVSRKRKEGGLKPAVVLHADDDLTSLLLPDFRVSVATLFE